MKRITKLRLYAVYLGIIFALSTGLHFSLSKNEWSVNRINQNAERLNFRLARYWNLTGTPIDIDDSDPSKNWSYTALNYDWCTGSGTWSDPYTIENVIIDGLGEGTCISIRNSNIYFIIKNSTTYNSGRAMSYAGIYFHRVNNGILINNNCSNNAGNGILLSRSKDNIISGNTVNNNWYYGILIDYNCTNNKILESIANNNRYGGILLHHNNNNTLSGNTVIDNGSFGICLQVVCENNTILGNIVNNNHDTGIVFYDNCKNNTVSGNTVNNYAWGIYLRDNCDNNIILGNNVNNNSFYGISLRENCDNNIISGNTANNNTNSGIYLQNGCNDTTISGNFIKNNGIYGIEIADISCQNNLVFQNLLLGTTECYARDNGANNQWDNSIVGNYWDNHTSPDADNNGIVDFPYIWIAGSAGSVDQFPLTENPIHLGEKIHIDDSSVSALNWSATAKVKLWCTGSGTYSDPYIIDGLEIDAGGSGSGILIGNSSVYFIIRTCEVTNTIYGAYPDYDAGIKLDNTNNGTLINNNFSNNDYGIYINEGSYNEIVGNNIYGTTYATGIYIEGDNNIIEKNIIKNNGQGIYLSYSCNNIISENMINNNNNNGISLYNCNNNTISNNIVNNNIHYGIYLENDCDENTISENYLYFNLDEAINISSADCDDNIFERNVLVSNDFKFINDNGTNTKVILNYFNNILPTFAVVVIAQSFSTTEFVVTLNISCEITGFEVSNLSIHMWWNGIVVSSNSIIDLGNRLYNVSLTPIIVAPGEEPIVLNMTISAAHHRDKYFETYISVEPPKIVKYLQVEIIDQSFSTEEFYITFFIHNATGYGIDFATIQIWWDSIDVSADIQNLGNGNYFISLGPITVDPDENPILLSMTISATGYEDKYFETYIAVDPASLLKGEGEPREELPLALIIIISTISAGVIIGLVSIYWLRKRKKEL